MNNRFLLRRSNRLFFILVLCFVLVGILVVDSFAAANVKGFSVYRQGNFPNPSGHAGLVNKESVEDNDSIIHIISGDADHLIRKTSLAEFKDGQDFYGYYIPETLESLSASDRSIMLSRVISRARTLSVMNREALGYNLINQVWYTTDANSNGRVDITEISSMRCDGLVEYCYEYNDFDVYGDDISEFDFDIRDDHSAPNVTPKQQIKHYLKNCLGDIDGDSMVTAGDARLALRYSTGLEVFDEYQTFVADVDGSIGITARDAQLILNHSTDLTITFPADPFP